MKRRMPSIVYSVDAGGSGTVVAVWRAGVVVDTSFYPSIAIASTGTTAACQSLSDVLRGITEHVGKDSWALGCIGSSSMPVAAEAPAPKPLLDVIAVHAPRGRVVLVNDVVPLLWSTPLAGVGIVICSGTGSSVLGRNANGEQTKVGGHEHIVSDQGSAYSLAREGLRAAGRSNDGTGPTTKLQSLAESFFDLPIPALGRWLAELPRPRTTIASFAPQVTAAAESGDPVAETIVQTEARALVDAAVVGATRLSFRLVATHRARGRRSAQERVLPQARRGGAGAAGPHRHELSKRPSHQRCAGRRRIRTAARRRLARRRTSADAGRRGAGLVELVLEM